MLTHLRTPEDLQTYLNAALRLEHATLPPYLTALYSIRPGTNTDAYHVLRVVAVEEMLHLTLAANVMNAVGGSPDLTVADFVPAYPAYLPDGETDFTVSLRPFSREAVETFLKIERPREAPDDESRVVRRPAPEPSRLAVVPDEPTLQFHSIGEFYAEIVRGLRDLHTEMGAALFSGDPARQVTPEYFYSGGGEVVVVTDLDSAEAALRLIAEQGEGLGGGIYDEERELAHYYRFEQLVLGRYYQPGDQAGAPTGPAVNVDWESSCPVKVDPRVEDYPEDSELRDAALAFNRLYADFLQLLTSAYTGSPDRLLEAVPFMFRLRDRMLQLINNPLPGFDGLNAGPTFEVALVPAEAP